MKPPVEWPLHDAARALQFVRSKAAEWNIDKQRIGASGGSAGACSSLWLAFHPDMADPKSSDPVARESTRLWCAAVTGAQTTLDPQQMKEWTPNSRYGGHAFGFKGDPAKEALAVRRFPRRPRQDPALDRRVLPLRPRDRRRPARLPHLLHAARAGAGPEGPDAHVELRREAPGEVQERGRGVRAGLSRRARREAPDVQSYLVDKLKAAKR